MIALLYQTKSVLLSKEVIAVYKTNAKYHLYSLYSAEYDLEIH